MQLNKVNDSFDNLKFIFVLPTVVQKGTLLCHSLVRHTIMQLFFFSISLVLFVCYAALIIYYRRSWLAIPTTQLFHNHQVPVKFTVIIPARNEAQNIKSCLDSILNQTYTTKPYEVIVVDDFSTDTTAAIVKSYGEKVKLISLKDHLDGPFNSYKKRALEIAIAQSAGDIIAVTDADCVVPATWLQNIAFCFSAEDYRMDPTVFVVAPVLYTGRQTFIHIFQALDFMTLQGITGAAVFKKAHSMCNGANLAYSKKAFYAAGGFEGIDTIASGDDMLLMHKIFKQHPNGVRFLKSAGAVVSTKPMDTLKDFFNQRIRWASKADKYDDKRIFGVLLLVYLFNAWFAVLLIAAFFYPVIFYWLVVLLIGKTLVELFFLYPVATFFSKQHLLFYFPFAQPFHILYTIIAGWLGKFGSYQWKGREVK